ncbi:hypothetical protein ACW910_24385 (plasmid) [Burkholderia ambifaria]
MTIDIEKMKALAAHLRSQEAVDAKPREIEMFTDEAATAIDTLLSELEAAKRENSDMIKALAECRDAMPMEYDSPHLGGAVGDPIEVPLFVKDIVARMRAELEAREADRLDAERYRWLCDGNGYFLEEQAICGYVNDKAEADAAIDASLAQRQEGEEK